MMMRHRQNCGNCDAYFPTQRAQKIGVCRDKPPTVVMVQVQNPAAMLDPKQHPIMQGVQGVYPPVAESGWCRKWSQKTEGEA